MAAKPDFLDNEIDHYKAMVGMIIDGDPKKKRELDDIARLSIAQAKKNMPTADDEALVTFFASIAFLMAHLMNTPVKNIAEVIENTFDGYTVAAAYVIGAYDIEGDELPVKREPAQRPDAAASPADDVNTGLYLLCGPRSAGTAASLFCRNRCSVPGSMSTSVKRAMSNGLSRNTG